VVIHLVGCPQRPDAEAVPGQMKATLDGTAAFRVRAAVNSFILPNRESRSASAHSGWAIGAADTVEVLQTLACSMYQSRDLRLGRSGGTSSEPPGVPGTLWWQSTELRDQYEIESGRASHRSS
jgi:hypothetical protein